MAEEEKKDVMVLPDSEEIPEKFRGKPVEEVIRSYAEAEKTMTKTNQEKNELAKKLEELQRVEPEPELEPEPDTEDYEYLTKAQMNAMLKKQEKEHAEALKKMGQETTNQVMAQIERRQFIDKHSELFPADMGPEAVDKKIQQIAALGFASGAQSLEGALKITEELAKSLGYANSVSPEVRTIPANMNSTIENASPEDELDRMAKTNKLNSGSISSTIKY